MVKSESLGLEDLTSTLGRVSDRGHDLGSFSPRQPGNVWLWSQWEIDLVLDEKDHAGTEAVSAAIESLGSELADRAGDLARQGCISTLVVVQELPADDSSQHGFWLSAEAVAWIARARATLDIDQYVLD